MLYFLGQFGENLQLFNVFRYITFRTAGGVVTAIFFVFMFGPTIIPALKIRQGKGQPIREDGPAGHLDQEGHAHHGRADDPLGRDRLDPALVQPRQRLCLGRARS